MSSAGWEAIASDTRGSVTALARGAATIVFATTPVGVYRSIDAGRTWEFSGGSTGVAFGETVAASGNDVFVGAPDGLHHSADGGRGWQPVLTGSRVAAVCAGAGIVLAGTATDGVLRSEDAGRQWSGVNAGLLDLEVLAVCLSPSFPGDRLAFVGTASGIYRSRNGGDSWRAVDTGLDEPAVQCIAMGADRLVVAGTEADGLVCSEDGGTTWWQPADLAARSVSAVAFSSAGGITAATDVGLFFSADRGHSWDLRQTQGDTLALLYLEDGVLLAGAERTGAWRSDDDGATWSEASSGLHASLLSTLVVGTDERVWTAGASEGVRVWRSGSWQERNDGLGDAAVAGLSVTADGHTFAAASDGVYLWSGSTWRKRFAGAVRAAGGSKRVVAMAEGIVASDDLGETWCTLATPFAADAVIALAGSESVLAVACREAAATVVWRSADGGAHWERAFADAAPRMTLPLAISGDAVFVGLDRRVVRSDGASSAQLEGAITALAAAADDSVWVATTHGVFVSRDRAESFNPAGGPKRVIAIAPPYALELGGRLWHCPDSG